jgi:lactoylglutathione lyase
MAPHALFETHLKVKDLARSKHFYQAIVGLEIAYELPERQMVFFWIGEPGRSMLGIWAGPDSPVRTTIHHLAFAMDLDEVLAAADRLKQAEVEPLDFFNQPTTEPSVIGWMPAASIYFRDPDGHLLEYLAMLPDAPKPEAGIVNYSEWSAGRTSLKQPT